jgi:hypothetical protein
MLTVKNVATAPCPAVLQKEHPPSLSFVCSSPSTAVLVRPFPDLGQILHLTSCAQIFSSNLSLGTMSKAFAKSRNITSKGFHCTNGCLKNSRRFVQQDILGSKSCFGLVFLNHST